MRKLTMYLSFFSVLSLHAQPSASIKDIPVFPTATYMEEASRSIMEGASFAVKNEFEGMSVVEFETRAYSVNAAQDEVISYYRKKLNAVDVRGGVRLPRYADIRPNSSTKVFLEYTVVWTSFFWDRKDAHGDIFHFLVTVSDSIGFRGATGQTILGLNFKHYSKEVKIVVPTEEELGAPRYPNATYVAEESRRSGFMGFHTFLTDDNSGTVAAFFEGKLQKKPLPGPTSESFFLNDFSEKHPGNSILIERVERQGRTLVRIYYICASQ